MSDTSDEKRQCTDESGSNMDLTMLALLNATERDKEGWYELFKEADPRFKVQCISMTPPGLMGIIEVGWEEQHA